MTLTRPTRLAVAAAALFAAACSDSPLQPASSANLDAALSEMSLSSLAPAGILGMGVPAPSTALVPSQCAYASGSQSFVCAPLSFNGLTYDRSFALLTTSGAPQAAFDPATTDAVRTMTSVTGTMSFSGLTGSSTSGSISSTVDDHSTMTLSGLLSGRHVLNGQDDLKLTTTGLGSAPFITTMTTTISGLVPPANGSHYPQAGSITAVMSGLDAGLGSSTFSMTMVFNGTSKVDVTMVDGGTTTHCTLDLANMSASASACFGVPLI